MNRNTAEFAYGAAVFSIVLIARERKRDQRNQRRHPHRHRFGQPQQRHQQPDGRREAHGRA